MNQVVAYDPRIDEVLERMRSLERVLEVRVITSGYEGRKFVAHVLDVQKPKKDRDKLPVMIFGLDGTLADNRHRLHLINVEDDDKCVRCRHRKSEHYKLRIRRGGCLHNVAQDPRDYEVPCKCRGYKADSDWEEFYARIGMDMPFKETAALARALYPTHNIAIVTGRPEEYRGVTREQLHNFDIKFDQLHMRPEHDFRSNGAHKQHVFEEFIRFNYENIAGAVEANATSAATYRNLGIPVYQLLMKGQK